MLEDLLVAALNDAQKKIEAEVQAKMTVATGGMKLPF
jgi:DNA-binding protein YbaB